MSEPTVDEVIVKILRDEIDDLRRKVAIAERAMKGAISNLRETHPEHQGTAKRIAFELLSNALDAMKGGSEAKDDT